MLNYRHYQVILSLILLTFSGCTPTLSTDPDFQHQTSSSLQSSEYIPPSPEKEEIFQRTMHSIGSNIQNDLAYQRIDFETAEEKKWFKTLTYRLWDRQITRQQFLAQGLEKYPQHEYEFNFIIRNFTT